MCCCLFGVCSSCYHVLSDGACMCHPQCQICDYWLLYVFLLSDHNTPWYRLDEYTVVVSLVCDFRLLTGLELLFRWRSYFSSPCCIVSEPVFSSDFCIPFFGQKHFNIKLYSDSYVFIILNRWIFGCPLSFGRSRAMEVSHRWRGDAFNKVVDVMI